MLPPPNISPEGRSSRFLPKNRTFFILLALYLVIGLLFLLQTAHGDGILWMNARRSPVFDWFFLYGTRLGEPITYLILTLLLLFVQFRTALVVPLIGFSALGLSHLTKALFLQERPMTYFQRLNRWEELQIQEGYQLAEGLTSFPSGHTLSAFALFGFLAFSSSQKGWTAVGLFGLALIVAISRVYLVQHFVEDVLFGSIIGVLLALFWHWLQFVLFPERVRFWNRSVIRF